MCYPAIIIDSTIFILKVYDFLSKANFQPILLALVTEPLRGFSVPNEYTVTAGHNGDFLAPKAKRDCEMQGLCQGAFLPNPAGREGRQGLAEMAP